MISAFVCVVYTRARDLIIIMGHVSLTSHVKPPRYMLIRVICCLNKVVKAARCKLGTAIMVFCILSRVILLFSVHLFALAGGVTVVSATIIPLSLDNALHG